MDNESLLKTFPVRLTETQLAQLADEAKRLRRPRSWVIREALDAWFTGGAAEQ